MIAFVDEFDTRQPIRQRAARVYRALIDADTVAVWKVPNGMTCHVHSFNPVKGGALRISLTDGAQAV
ncbi:MAG: hypothetical protein JO185_05285 [Acidobacteriaceae bacterium]|nr:hypothetical protein [Acidobacteriaceae bacterium]